MQKSIKKSLCVLLSILMIVGVFAIVPITASAVTQNDIYDLQDQMNTLAEEREQQDDYDAASALYSSSNALDYQFYESGFNANDPNVERAYNIALAVYNHFNGTGSVDVTSVSRTEVDKLSEALADLMYDYMMSDDNNNASVLGNADRILRAAASDATTENDPKLLSAYSLASFILAQYTGTTGSYTVTWNNWDGSVLETDENVAADSTPTYDGEAPTKAEDEQNTYTFSGWNDGQTTYGLSDTLPAVSGDVTYTAQFTETAKPLPEVIKDCTYQKTDSANFANVPFKPDDASDYSSLLDGAIDIKFLSGTIMLGDAKGYSYKFYDQTGTEIAATLSNSSEAGFSDDVTLYVKTFTLTIPDNLDKFYIVATEPAPAPAMLILNVGENGKVVMDHGTFGNATDASNITDIARPINVADGSNASIVDGYTCNIVEGGSINIATGGRVSFYLTAENTGVITAIPDEGYICTGWYNGDTLYSSDAALSYQNISEDITLTAKFAPELPDVIKDCTYELPPEYGYAIYANVPFATQSYDELLTGAIVFDGYIGDTMHYSYTFYDQNGTDITPALISSSTTPGDVFGLSDDVTMYVYDYGFINSMPDTLYIVATAPSGYTVTWKNWDGTVLETDENVAAGSTPTYDGEAPEKAADAQNTYTFSGWNDGQTTYGLSDTLPAVTGDVTYTAQFEETPKHQHDGITFEKWTSDNSLPTEAGNYVLTSDVTLSGTWTVPEGETNLCLNGHGIKRTGNGNVITVSSDASLTLYDCDRTTTHYYTIASPTGNGAGLATVGESGTAFTGGYITGGNNSNGGGVIVEGTFTMNAGTIIGNNASNTGAGVFVAASGSFNMNDGALIGNTAQYGGGVGSAAGDSKPTSLVISGGTVAYNRTTGTGGGVHTNANGRTPGVNGTDLTIDGPVKIINNHTNGVWNNANAGGGVVIDGSGIRFNLSGNPVIKENTAGSAGSPNNLYFYDRGNPKVNISGKLTKDNRIGVTMRSPGVFTTGYNTYHPDDDPADYFTSDDTNYLVKTDFNGEVQLRLNGSSVASVTVGETTIEYASFAEALSAWTNGSTLTLLADVTISSTIGVSGTKTLDLNGYGIKTAGGVAITVNNSADLTMKDSAPTRTGTGTNRPNGVEGGYLTGFNGGTNSACVVINAAKFTMDGGSITGNIGKGNGAAVMMSEKKANEFVMNGGSITNNKAGVGAGIYCYTIGKVTMTGGIVSDNVSTDTNALSGGMLIHGSLTMTGGTVTRNTVGVRVWQRASVVNLSGNARITDNTVNGTAYRNLDMSGGQASQNCVKVTGTLGDDALIGITMKTPGVFTNSTDTSLNDASKFFSDNSSYIVGKNAAGQLRLGVPRTVTWKDDTGNIIDTTTVANGCVPTHAAPSKAADNYYTYTFAGWNDGQTTYGLSDTLPAVSGDVTYTAVFTAEPIIYTVTWKNWDGTVLETDENVAAGSTPTYDGEAPERAADAQNTYTFAAWDDGTTTYVLGVDDLPAVTADVTYTAVFTAETNTYKVTWKNWDGNVLKVDENVPYGTVPEYKGARPEKPDVEDTAYTFTGWTPEVTAVSGDVEYTAEFGVHELIGDYYYVNGQRVGSYYGLIKYDGDFYYVDKYSKIIKNDDHWLVTTNGWTFADGTPIPKATYSFDADGKMIIPNGLVGDCYYIDGVKVGSYYGLVMDNGNYYYVDNNAKIVKNKTKFLNTTNGLTFADGTPIPKATYSFDEDGKMIIPNGIDGDFYYINGVKVGSYYGLVKDGNDYYYVDANAKIVRSKNKYLTSTNDLTFPDGTPIPHKYFEFDADGKMIF